MKIGGSFPHICLEPETEQFLYKLPNYCLQMNLQITDFEREKINVDPCKS